MFGRSHQCRSLSSLQPYVDEALWVRARADDFKPASRKIAQQAFRHLAPGRIACAQEKHSFLTVHFASPYCVQLRRHRHTEAMPEPANETVPLRSWHPQIEKE